MPNIFARCCCGGGVICIYCTRLVLTVIAIIVGTLIAWKPKKTIDIQIAIYRLINWKMEPISMEKEIRNTRIMGAIVLIAGVLAIMYTYLF